MSAQMSRRKSKRALWSSARLCVKCGKPVVRLRVQGGGFKLCYVKGWDWNPWYTPRIRYNGSPIAGHGNAYPHPRRCHGKAPEPVYDPLPEEKKEDPFFTLP